MIQKTDDIYWLLKSSCFELFRGGKYGLSFSQKVDGKMIFNNYWKILVLNFLKVGNIVFFWAKRLMERWYWLLKSSCFELFGGGKYGLFFEPKSWWKDETYWLLKSSCSELFGDEKYGRFLSRKVDGKMIFTCFVFLFFFSFPWYSRTWEIWFFVQLLLSGCKSANKYIIDDISRLVIWSAFG